MRRRHQELVVAETVKDDQNGIVESLAERVFSMPPVMMVLAAAALLAGAAWAQTPDPANEARRAQELVAAGRLDEAVRIYRDLVGASPGNPVLLLNLCITEYKAKQYAEAVAKALEHLDKAEQSLNWAQRAAALDADYSDAWYLMARLYRKLGREEKAEEARQRFLAAKAKEPVQRK